MNIGNNLVKLREAKGLKQYELAKLINVSDKTISSYENNRSLPNIEILVLLANALDTNIDTILGLNKDNANTINDTYKKKNLRDTIKKLIIFSFITIIPILFFYYSGLIVISSFIGLIQSNENIHLVSEAKSIIELYNSYIIEYLIYILIMFVNYILYKKKFFIPLLIVNGIMLILFVTDIILNGLPLALDMFIFPLAWLFGTAASIKLFFTNKKIN